MDGMACPLMVNDHHNGLMNAQARKASFAPAGGIG
jgi:hypothetical protein